MNHRKPRIGLLGLMTEGYEPIFPGITERQTKFAKELAAHFAPVADVVFDGPGLNREGIERIVKSYNEQELDGILIVLLAYSPGAYLTRALEYNHLPLALAVIQPDSVVEDDFEELDLTVNQGIHGAQDNASVIVKSGRHCEFFVAERNSPELMEFVGDFAKAAYARTVLKQMKVAVFSRMAGMGDILTDEFAFTRVIGPEIIHDTIGSVYSRMQAVPEEKIEEQIAADHQRFDVDPKLLHDAHAEAVRMYLGFKSYLEEKGMDAYTAHFDQFGDDGRFKQLPLYAASTLLSEGYGYAAEGDFSCAAMVAAGGALADGDANFTEMYMVDYEKKAIVFCHAGEGNFATARQDKKVRLIDRYLGEGGLENPPTHIFTPRVGPATLTSLAYAGDGKFRLVAAKGQILEKDDLRRCEMPYLFWRPECGPERCVTEWLKNGGTHHEVINIGDVSRRWRMLCDMLGVEYKEI